MSIWKIEENVTNLKDLWASGLPAPLIARQIPGSTKNAIIGKAHRMGLVARATGSKPARPRRLERVKTITLRAPSVEPPKPIVVTPPTTAPETWIPFMKAGSTTCRAIMLEKGADGLAMWCPTPKDPKDSYCLYHIGLYYNFNVKR